MLTTQDAITLQHLATLLYSYRDAIRTEWVKVCSAYDVRFPPTMLAPARRAIVDLFFRHVSRGDVNAYVTAVQNVRFASAGQNETSGLLGLAFCAFQDVVLSRVGRSKAATKNTIPAASLHRLGLEIVLLRPEASPTGFSVRKAVSRGRRDLLTRREKEVAELLAQGLRNKRIAQRLGISVRTVEHHRARIREKLGIDSVAGLSSLITRSTEDENESF